MRNTLAFYVSKFAHRKQKRKYTGVSYHTHCVEVARLVKEYGGSDNEIQAAFLHDVIEDTTLSPWWIKLIFGSQVLQLVDELTEKTTLLDGNRKVRKRLELDRLRDVSLNAKFVKLADMISNTKGIKEHDPRFYYTTYRQECIDIAHVCRIASEKMFIRVMNQLDSSY